MVHPRHLHNHKSRLFCLICNIHSCPRGCSHSIASSSKCSLLLVLHMSRLGSYPLWCWREQGWSSPVTLVTLSFPGGSQFQIPCVSSECVAWVPSQKLQNIHIGHTLEPWQQHFHHWRSEMESSAASLPWIPLSAWHFSEALRGLPFSWSPDLLLPCSWCPRRRWSQDQWKGRSWRLGPG